MVFLNLGAETSVWFCHFDRVRRPFAAAVACQLHTDDTVCWKKVRERLATKVHGLCSPGCCQSIEAFKIARGLTPRILAPLFEFENMRSACRASSLPNPNPAKFPELDRVQQFRELSFQSVRASGSGPRLSKDLGKQQHLHEYLASICKVHLLLGPQVGHVIISPFAPLTLPPPPQVSQAPIFWRYSGWVCNSVADVGGREGTGFWDSHEIAAPENEFICPDTRRTKESWSWDKRLTENRRPPSH